jgi:hypothetical protein
VTRLYIEAEFTGRELVTSVEAVYMISDERYSDWLDANKDSIAAKIEEEMGEQINRESEEGDEDEEDDEDEDDDDEDDDDEDDDDEDDDDEDETATQVGGDGEGRVEGDL